MKRTTVPHANACLRLAPSRNQRTPAAIPHATQPLPPVSMAWMRAAKKSLQATQQALRLRFWTSQEIRCSPTSSRHHSPRLFLVVLVCAVGFSWLGCSNEEVLARAEKVSSRGFPYRVTAKKVAQQYRVELLFNDRLPLSSYQFYAGSDAATNATIAWPQLGDFTVVFGVGKSVHCSWDDNKVVWEQR